MKKQQLTGLESIHRMAQQAHEQRLATLDKTADKRQWKLIEKSVGKIRKNVYQNHYEN